MKMNADMTLPLEGLLQEAFPKAFYHILSKNTKSVS
jgi:hypothetical protein